MMMNVLFMGHYILIVFIIPIVFYAKYIFYRIELLPSEIVLHFPFRSMRFKKGTLREFEIGWYWPFKDLALYFEGGSKIRLLAPTRLKEFEAELQRFLVENENEQEPADV